MSLKYRNHEGVETPISGLNGTSGELVPSVALYQTGIPYIPATVAGETFTIAVVLATPMPDDDYVVNVTDPNGGLQGRLLVQNVISRSTTGFTVRGYNLTGANIPDNTFAIRWQAFKLMTDTVHQADTAHISQNTANFAPAFSEVTSYAVGDYVTYNNVLYRCTTAHTAGVWVAGHFTAVTVGGALTNKCVSVDATSNSVTIPSLEEDTATITVTSPNGEAPKAWSIVTSTNAWLGVGVHKVTWTKGSNNIYTGLVQIINVAGGQISGTVTLRILF